MLQQKQQLPAHAQRPAAAIQLGHAAHQMADEHALGGVVADHADLVRVHLRQLAQVVQNHARGQQVGVQRGVDLADHARHAQHGAGVVQQARTLGVVQLGRGGIVVQPVAALLQPGQHQLLQLGIAERVHAVEDVIQHLAGGLGRAGGQQRHVVVVGLGGQTHLVHAQLGLSVVFGHHAAHAQHVGDVGRGRVAVPELGVDLAGQIAQRHVQKFVAVGRGSLRGRAGEQEAVEHLSLDHFSQSRLRFHGHPSSYICYYNRRSRPRCQERSRAFAGAIRSAAVRRSSMRVAAWLCPAMMWWHWKTRFGMHCRNIRSLRKTAANEQISSICEISLPNMFSYIRK